MLDSSSEGEYEEMLLKAATPLRAYGTVMLAESAAAGSMPSAERAR